MTPWIFAAIFVAVASTVVGQVLFKVAMNQTNGDWRLSRFLPIFSAGIATMALGFFLWLGLMARFDLSYLFPFEGLDRLLLVFAASVVLKERMTPTLWLGVVLITAGIFLVSVSESEKKPAAAQAPALRVESLGVGNDEKRR